MNKSRKLKAFNCVVAALFLLLLAGHLYIASRVPEWNRHYQTFWPTVDVLIIRPVLGLCAGYSLTFGLFCLLRARIDMVAAGGRHFLRWVMGAITAALLGVVFVMLAMMLCSVVGIEFFNLGARTYMFLGDICQLGWLWPLLGVYWFIDFNTNRVAELPEDDEAQPEFA